MNSTIRKILPGIGKPNKEKGAALVTVVLLLMLLLTVAGAVIMFTALSNTSTVDATDEEQAYYAAEAGMQMTLNVLRGNGTGSAVSFKKAALRYSSNKGDDWYPDARLSNWLNYSYPASQPDRVTLTTPYAPATGLAFSVTLSAPDAVTTAEPTPDPDWIDGPVVMPDPKIKPPAPPWHPWHCAHCSWDYSHCSLYPAGTRRKDGLGCRHKHCIPPAGWNAGPDDGYQRLLVKVVGYGPRGAQKQIELLVKRLIFDYDSESMIFAHGSSLGGDLSFGISGTPEINFDGGESIAFGLRTESDSLILQSAIALDDKVKIAGKGDDVEVFNADDIPEWLESVNSTSSLVRDLKTDAQLRGRYYNGYPTGSAGTDSDPQMTFVDGDCSLTSDGAGLLVVTGKLNLNSNKKFKGLIMILGQGELNVTSGDSTIEGAIVLAKYNSSGEFLAPAIKLSGGKYTFKYNESKVENAVKTVNLAVVGAREY